MAVDAAARLYDVDEDSVVFEKLQKTERYDQGTVTFQARKGKLISLDKLHESIWATRLSGGTRSGLVSLVVTATGNVKTSKGEIRLNVAGSRAEFILAKHTDDQFSPVFGEIKKIDGRQVRVTGLIDDYKGRWPGVLKKKPQNPRRILVTDFNFVNELALRDRTATSNTKTPVRR